MYIYILWDTFETFLNQLIPHFFPHSLMCSQPKFEKFIFLNIWSFSGKVATEVTWYGKNLKKKSLHILIFYIALQLLTPVLTACPLQVALHFY